MTQGLSQEKDIWKEKRKKVLPKEFGANYNCRLVRQYRKHSSIYFLNPLMVYNEENIDPDVPF